MKQKSDGTEKQMRTKSFQQCSQQKIPDIAKEKKERDRGGGDREGTNKNKGFHFDKMYEWHTFDWNST